jgi:membrane protein
MLARDAGQRWADDACYRLGASLAYYALFSLFPLLLLSVTGVGYVLGNDDSVRQSVLGSTAKMGSPESRALLDQTLQSMQAHRTARGVGAIVGAVTLLFGASGVFSELESSLNFIWRVKPEKTGGFWTTALHTIKGKAFSFAVVVFSAVALLAAVVLSTVLGAMQKMAAVVVGAGSIWHMVDAAFSVGLLTLLLATIYRVVPKAKVEWGDVLGAGLITAVLLAALKTVLAWYLARLGSYAAYGAVGAVLALLTWIYFASVVVLYGAEFSRIYAERFGSLARQYGIGVPKPRGPEKS